MSPNQSSSIYLSAFASALWRQTFCNPRFRSNTSNKLRESKASVISVLFVLCKLQGRLDDSSMLAHSITKASFNWTVGAKCGGRRGLNVRRKAQLHADLWTVFPGTDFLCPAGHVLSLLLSSSNDNTVVTELTVKSQAVEADSQMAQSQ